MWWVELRCMHRCMHAKSSSPPNGHTLMPPTRSRSPSRSTRARAASPSGASPSGRGVATSQVGAAAWSSPIAGWVQQQRDFISAVERHAFHPRFALKHASYSAGEAGSRITMIGAVVNCLLAVFKALAGHYGHSAAMCAAAPPPHPPAHVARASCACRPPKASVGARPKAHTLVPCPTQGV